VGRRLWKRKGSGLYGKGWHRLLLTWPWNMRFVWGLMRCFSPRLRIRKLASWVIKGGWCPGLVLEFLRPLLLLLLLRSVNVCLRIFFSENCEIWCSTNVPCTWIWFFFRDFASQDDFVSMPMFQLLVLGFPGLVLISLVGNGNGVWLVRWWVINSLVFMLPSGFKGTFESLYLSGQPHECFSFFFLKFCNKEIFESGSVKRNYIGYFMMRVVMGGKEKK